MTNTIAHELVHYQLMDEGKPLGHSPAFKRRVIQLMKRDRQLDVMNIIKLQQCTQPEEPEWIRTGRNTRTFHYPMSPPISRSG